MVASVLTGQLVGLNTTKTNTPWHWVRHISYKYKFKYDGVFWFFF